MHFDSVQNGYLCCCRTKEEVPSLAIYEHFRPHSSSVSFSRFAQHFPKPFVHISEPKTRQLPPGGSNKLNRTPTLIPSKFVFYRLKAPSTAVGGLSIFRLLPKEKACSFVQHSVFLLTMVCIQFIMYTIFPYERNGRT